MMRVLFLISICYAMVTLLGCRQTDDEQGPAIAATSLSPAAAIARPSTTGDSAGQTPLQPDLSPEPAVSTAAGAGPATYGFTHQQPDGNRLVSGKGNLPEATVIDIPLLGRPAWIVGAPITEKTGAGPTDSEPASIWAVVMDDGQVQAFTVRGRQVVETPIEPGMLPNTPPLLQVTGDVPELLSSPSSGLAPPAVLDDQGSLAVISPAGAVTILDPSGVPLFSAGSRPLPDARLLVDEGGRLLYLSQPTTRYDHAIAGDEFEAASITMLDVQGRDSDELIIPVPEPAVVEGIMPLWVDLNGDGRREIIVTLSDAQNGAQINVYDDTGQWIAAGPDIGQGYRWRHQLAVAPFGPNGELELAAVLTPHIGGVVEFYQLVGGELRIVAQAPGYTSHVIGSRNLDMALAGDLDGDDAIELLLPNQARTALGAIRHTGSGAEVVWAVPLNGVLSSNLAAVPLVGGQLAIGAGREDGTLRLWLP